jgi:hypothetical protein
MSRGGRPFIPRADGDCAVWAAQFSSTCGSYSGVLHLPDPVLTEIADAVSAFASAIEAHDAARNAAQAAALAKREARAAMEKMLRRFTRGFQSNPGVTDALRARLGITVPTGALTPSPAPTTAPSVSVEHSSRLTHTLRLVDSAAPTRTAKPRGVQGAEVWVALTEPGDSAPTDPLAYRYHQLTTRDTVQRTFVAAEGGKTAHYQLRWVSTRGERGPWSEVCAATVAA